MTLAGNGTLAYNGVEFSGLFRSRIRGRRIPDRANRTTKWVEYTIEARGYITASPGYAGAGNVTTDTTLETMRESLMATGGELQYEDKGFGTTFHINGDSPIKDANWGPKPLLLSFDPVGADQAAGVEWQCTTCIPECEDAFYDGICDYSYETSYNIDQDAYTTRTISGVIEIAQTRFDGSRNVQQTADDYKERVTPPVPLGFKRTKNSFSVSADKNSARFEYVDEQIPVPYPDKASTIDIRATVDSEFYNKGFKRWDYSFDGTVVVPPVYSRPTFFDVFFFVIFQRLRSMNMSVVGAQGLGVFEGNARKKMYPTRFRVTEDVFGRGATFSASFCLLGADLSTILVESGFWQPIGATSFASWKRSMESSAQHPRGHADLREDGDVIVDLCTGEPPTTLKPRTNLPEVARRGRVLAANAGGVKGVDPENSWIAYECRLVLVKRNRIARHHPLPVEDPDKFAVIAGPSALGAFSQLDKGKDSTISFEPVQKNRDIIQILGDPTYDLVLYGAAQRLGHQIPVPRLHSVGGVKPVEVSLMEDFGEVGKAGRIPIVGGWWRVVYTLDRKPTGALPVPANPLYGTDGGNSSNPLAK